MARNYVQDYKELAPVPQAVAAGVVANLSLDLQTITLQKGETMKIWNAFGWVTGDSRLLLCSAGGLTLDVMAVNGTWSGIQLALGDNQIVQEQQISNGGFAVQASGKGPLLEISGSLVMPPVPSESFLGGSPGGYRLGLYFDVRNSDVAIRNVTGMAAQWLYSIE
jgi:hypothetical protein